MQLTEEQNADIQAKYVKCVEAKAEVDRVALVWGNNEKQLRKERSGHSSRAEFLANQALGSTDVEKTKEPKPLHKTVTALTETSRGLRKRMDDADVAYVVARGDFRVAILNVVREDMMGRLMTYERHASNLEDAWVRLTEVCKWLENNGGGTHLSHDFVTGVRVPNVKGGPMLVDGRGGHKFAYRIKELLDQEQRIMFFGEAEPTFKFSEVRR